MSNITAKVLADDDMPCRAMSSIELFLDMCGDVLLDVVLLESSIRDVDRFLLELFAHIHILDDGLWASRNGGNAACGSIGGGRIGFDISHGEKREWR